MDALTADVLVLSLAAAADQASTGYALRACDRCYEANPAMREPAVALPLKAGGIAAVSAGCARLRRDGHRGWARAVRWGVAGLWFGLAAHNVGTARRHR